jgi:hypothetical protein
MTDLKCERCEHGWTPRDEKAKPKTCPSCRSPYWDKPMTEYWKKMKAKREAERAAK